MALLSVRFFLACCLLSSMVVNGGLLSGVVSGVVDNLLPGILNIPKQLANIDLDDQWKLFKVRFEKVYDVLDDVEKMKIFKVNVANIMNHNEDYLAGKTSFLQRVNLFADMDHDIFVKTMNGFKNDTPSSPSPNPTTPRTTFKAASRLPKVPASIDWRNKGAVTPVKNQGACGSCFTFSSTGALEGHNAIKYGELISLSEQNLVDCSQSYGNNGCDGGLMDNCFTYIQENGGIDAEDSYPYTANVETCQYNEENVGAFVTGIVQIPRGDENALKVAVGTVGPVAIAIDASQPSFQFYGEGIYYEPTCTQNIDHAVLVVGYGTENGKDYWLVKNSWGTDWGLQGYVKMARNVNNHCGIASWGSYPLV